MKFKGFLAFVVLFTSQLIATGIETSSANTWAVPQMKSFDFSPKEIELTSDNTSVKVTLIVTHPIGIADEKVRLHFKKDSSSDYAVDIPRVDNPINRTLTEVKFEAIVKLPNTFSNGVWNLSTDPVQAFAPTGSSQRPVSGEFTPLNFRNLLEAENDLLIRFNGYLDFDFKTFVGPSFTSEVSLTDNYPRTITTKNPVWRVGETFNPKDYFDIRSESTELLISSKTPSICASENNQLKLIGVGDCYYQVYTNRSRDFMAKELNLAALIQRARIKPELIIPSIPNQKVSALPIIISGATVYYQGFPVAPENKTPSVCIARQDLITVYSGGFCQIEYMVSESDTNLASEIYIQKFEIIKESQLISFTPPSTANLSAKTLALSATASGGGVITYQTTSTGICSITGSTLNLLKSGNCVITATQTGSATLAPISATATVMIAGSIAPTKKTITCIKGNKTKKVSGTNPKCPKGYKVKR